MAALDRATVKQGIIRDGQRYYPESRLLGSKKHGLDWAEGRARAMRTHTPQGQFGNLEDVMFAVERGAELGTDQSGIFSLPTGHHCTIYMPDGQLVEASQLFVKVYTDGKVHAYPML